MAVHTFVAGEGDGGKRTDHFLAELFPEVSRSALQKWLQEGRVSLGGKELAKNYKLRVGDKLSVTPPEEEGPFLPQPEAIPLSVVYEDACLLVVDKPKGMVVHPAPGNLTGTLVSALLHRYGEKGLSHLNGPLRPGILHRIDKDTSGLLMVAKNDEAHAALAKQISSHSFYRRYEAVVYGKVKDEAFTINAPIGRSPKDRKKMCVREDGREALSHVEVLGRYAGFTHVGVTLETGRTHQIRVHMASIGHPVAGDVVYGPKKAILSLSGQCLHAKTLGFHHPLSGEYMEFTSPLPPYFQAFLQKLTRE